MFSESLLKYFSLIKTWKRESFMKKRYLLMVTKFFSDKALRWATDGN